MRIILSFFIKIALFIPNMIMRFYNFLLKRKNIFSQQIVYGKAIQNAFPNEYVSLNVLPKQISHCNLFSSNQSFGIIMQGPIVRKKDFTLNTIKNYVQMYPNAKIIVSTWESENKDYLEKLKAVGAIIVLSSTPEKKGIYNVNYQMISTLAGVNYANSIGIEYVAKTRTDQRISNIFLFDLIFSLYKLYPLNSKSVFQRRVVTLPFQFGNLIFPYRFSDFFVFGYTEDIKLLFSRSLDVRSSVSVKGKTVAEVVKEYYCPEVYFWRNLIDENNLDYNITIKDYWRFVKDNLICIDISELQIVWNKYDLFRYCYQYQNGKFLNCEISNYSFGLENWLALMSGELKYKEEYESYLNLNYENTL